MKKAYSLDYSIQRDTERVAAVTEILDKLQHDPNATDLEQMASYILYGKDADGFNAVQRGEITDNNKRYNSYKKTDDKLVSLDELLDNPMVDQQKLKSAHQKDPYLHRKQSIKRPRYDKKTGALIDIGDGDIPGMSQLWDSIDRIEKWIYQVEGKLPADENTILFDDSYRLYRLKHTLIDLRRHQYYLKDAYKPQIHFNAVDHPKAQFYNWTADAFYWISYEEWQKRVNNALVHTVSRNIKDYETRGEGDTLEVKWYVCKHNFDWENPQHVRALFNQYSTLYEAMRDKLDTYGRTLLWDFDRYVSMCGFSELRLYLIQQKKMGLQYEDMLSNVLARYAVEYSPNYLISIINTEIPNRIAKIALIHRIDCDTPPSKRKLCIHCGRLLPKDPIFFSRNNARKDGLSNSCKECDRKLRIKKGVISNGDLRAKDPTLPKVQID